VSRLFGTLSRFTFSRRSAFKRRCVALLVRPSLRRVDAIHVATEAEQTEADRLSLDLEECAPVVPPPWRGDATPPNRETTADRPTALFMSRLHPKKNVAGLIEAWAHVVNEQPAAQLWIAGDGDDAYVQGLHETVATRNLGDSVSFLGFVSGAEKRRVLREAWAFALPSHQENFGVAVLEAVAAGLPVVLSGEVQLRAFVEAKDLGVIVDRTDPGSIAEGLRAVLDDAARRKRVAEQGPAAVQETFSLGQVGTQLRTLYEQALASCG